MTPEPDDQAADDVYYVVKRLEPLFPDGVPMDMVFRSLGETTQHTTDDILGAVNYLVDGGYLQRRDTGRFLTNTV